MHRRSVNVMYACAILSRRYVVYKVDRCSISYVQKEDTHKKRKSTSKTDEVPAVGFWK